MRHREGVDDSSCRTDGGQHPGDVDANSERDADRHGLPRTARDVDARAFGLEPYLPLISTFVDVLDRRDRDGLSSLFVQAMYGEPPGLLFARWGSRSGTEADVIPGTDATLDTFFAPPRLEVRDIVSLNCSGCSGATGLLLENWQDRSVDSIGKCDAACGPPRLVSLRGSSIVLVFYYEDGKLNSTRTFFGLAPADADWVKVADVPR